MLNTKQREPASNESGAGKIGNNELAARLVPEFMKYYAWETAAVRYNCHVGIGANGGPNETLVSLLFYRAIKHAANSYMLYECPLLFCLHKIATSL